MENEIKQVDVNLFQIERKGNDDFVIIEGLHAFKHATRFNAKFERIYVCDETITLQRAKKFLKSEEYDYLTKNLTVTSRDDFEKIAPNAIRTGIVGRAKKPTSLPIDNNGFVIVLEDPRDLNNVGAVVRAAAARGVNSVITIGNTSPWHTNALRGSAGLHFAQPVISVGSIEDLRNIFPDRDMISVSDEGGNVYDTEINPSSILIFGSERDGIKQSTKNLSDKIVGLPMQEGVSSMNLATAVSAFLFANKPINL